MLIGTCSLLGHKQQPLNLTVRIHAIEYILLVTLSLLIPVEALKANERKPVIL